MLGSDHCKTLVKTLGVVALAAFAAAAPASADWLITRDGARVETEGAWKIDGRRVVFTLPNGTLSAMRASEIDFEASDAASVAAVTPSAEPSGQEAAPTPRPEPVLVLTNKDIPQATAADPDAAPRPEVLPEIANREPVEVVNWKRIDAEEGLELRGMVRNTGSALAANVSVRASVKDEEGEVIATGNAFLGNGSLLSGRSTSFRIVLPEVDDFVGAPEFTVTSSRLTIGGAAAPRTSVTAADTAADEQTNGGASADDDALQEGGESAEESLPAGDDDIKP